MENKKTKTFNIIDIEKKFNAAKKLAKHIGLSEDESILKANQLIFDSMAVDCLDLFGVSKIKKNMKLIEKKSGRGRIRKMF
jgi:hypothetical protein